VGAGRQGGRDVQVGNLVDVPIEKDVASPGGPLRLYGAVGAAALRTPGAGLSRTVRLARRTLGRVAVMFRLCTALSALVLLLAACGGDDNGGGSSAQQSTSTATGGAQHASAEGKQVFTQNCGGCHTLADAGTNGQVGPNLDELKPDKARVQRQVTNGGSKMPAFKGRLSADQIDAVSTYVSSVAGKSS
jgi:mono/diheme cytochrome c family protein